MTRGHGTCRHALLAGAGAEYTEDDWTDPDTPGLPPYPRSKTIAERAAWDFMRGEGARSETELVVVNPTFILGPSLTAEAGSSTHLIKAMFGGEMRVAPRHLFGIADVRDVADLHFWAMAAPGAAGKRFIAVSDHPAMSYLELAELLRRRFGPLAARVPSEEAPGTTRLRSGCSNRASRTEAAYSPALACSRRARQAARLSSARESASSRGRDLPSELLAYLAGR